MTLGQLKETYFLFQKKYTISDDYIHCYMKKASVLGRTWEGNTVF